MISMCGLAFFLFIASEFVIPISRDVKNAKRNVPLGMILSLLIILGMQSLLVLGFGIIHRGANLQLLHRRIYCMGHYCLAMLEKYGCPL